MFKLIKQAINTVSNGFEILETLSEQAKLMAEEERQRAEVKAIIAKSRADMAVIKAKLAAAKLAKQLQEQQA